MTKRPPVESDIVLPLVTPVDGDMAEERKDGSASVDNKVSLSFLKEAVTDYKELFLAPANAKKSIRRNS